MPIENLDVELLPLLGAVLVIFSLGFGVGPLIRRLTDSIKPQNAWGGFLAAGRAIGMLETLLFTLSIIVGYPVFIGAWLAFKVAAKWETWAHVVRMPDLSAQDLASPEFDARARFGSWLHSRFIIGVLLNILVSVIGAWCYAQFVKILVAA